MNRNRFGGWILAGLLLLTAGAATAFEPPEDTCGSLTLKMAGPETVDVQAGPMAVTVTLANGGAAAMSGAVRLALIDGWTADPASEQQFTVAPGETATQAFQVTPAAASYNVFYPVHAWATFTEAGAAQTAHAILVTKAKTKNVYPPQAAAPAVAWRPWLVSGAHDLAVSHVPARRVFAEVFGETPRLLGMGWSGGDPVSGATLVSCVMKARPDNRESELAHPAWLGGKTGAVLSEYALQLPATPAKLTFAMAIRDTRPGEPQSDGVTWRVRVAPFDTPEEARGGVAFEEHWAGNTWKEAEVDLSQWAGQAVRLQLETHPGPKNDCTCDECYWGGLRLCFSAAAAAATPGAAAECALGRHVLIPGTRGLLDGTLTLRCPDVKTTIAGFPVRVFGESLADTAALTGVVASAPESIPGGWRIRHDLTRGEQHATLWGAITAADADGSVQVRYWLEDAPAPTPWNDVHIEDVSAGAWSELPRRVYAGVGNVLEEPQDFQLGFDGHQLATSFVGFEFSAHDSEGDPVTVVQAVDVPPSRLEFTRANKIATLHSGAACTMTLIPSNSVWRGVSILAGQQKDQPVAPGVARLRGRFVFDLWGGQYAASAEVLRKAFDYGLTDSMVLWHAWQRWGYDYRLPDILPPSPGCGTPEEFKALADTCKEAGVLFAPHDNYIDYYPDAEGFSYTKMGFNANATPIVSWYNEYRKAQAYRWGVADFQPAMMRNLTAIRDQFAPTGYFVDVWSSIGPYESWTWDGKYLPAMAARDAWREAFTSIRDTLGGAVTISESGHDQLVGWLDGSTANHLRVDMNPPAEGAGMTWRVDCKDSERVPWFDAMYHDRFVAHGAGYEARYRAGLDPRLHGIYSDDYITAEVMTGHPPMVDAPFGGDVVRKYWLLHYMQKVVADAHIQSVAFVEDNPHHQHIVWKTAAGSDFDVWINRGAEDWSPPLKEISSVVLPSYGFVAGDLAGMPESVCAGITRVAGQIVEWSVSGDTQYYNARPVARRGLPVKVTLDAVKEQEDGTLAVAMTWERTGPVTEDLLPFVHFVDKQGKILFMASNGFPAPIMEWTGPVRSEGVAQVPAGLDLSEPTEVRVGLWRPELGRRLLDGENDAELRLRLAALTLARDGDKVKVVQTAPVKGIEQEVLARMNPEGKMVEFKYGYLVPRFKTNGALRFTRTAEAILLTPLPDSGSFTVALEAGDGEGDSAASQPAACTVTALPDKTPVPVRREGDWMVFDIAPGVTAYELAGWGSATRVD